MRNGGKSPGWTRSPPPSNCARGWRKGCWWHCLRHLASKRATPCRIGCRQAGIHYLRAPKRPPVSFSGGQDNESRQQKKPRRDKRLDTMPISGQPILTFERAQRHWTGLGAPQLLDQPLTAFFASRQCPGAAIRAAMDWALAPASARRAVVGGFHSPLEQSVLRLLLEAHSPVVRWWRGRWVMHA